MSLEMEKIQHALEGALSALAESQGDEISRQIKPILLANLDRGRIQTFTDGNPDLVHTYVWLVAENFTRLNPHLHQLQTERNTEVWEPLYEQMQTWAYNFFRRKSFAADDHTREIAIECATNAAVNLLNAHFPYDTDFDPWIHTIVQHACRKYIQKALRKSVVPEEKMVDLEDNLVGTEDFLLEMESGDETATALAQLSEARRTVIQLIYFDELSPEETAQKMGKSVGAVYSLQFHALNDLRKILGTIRDNLNE